MLVLKIDDQKNLLVVKGSVPVSRLNSHIKPNNVVGKKEVKNHDNTETLKWDGKKSGKVTLDLAVAKETSSADLIHRAVLRQLAKKDKGQHQL